MDIISNSVSETKEIACRLAGYLKAGDIIALVGNLCTGKTVFVKGLASGLGCPQEKVLSPTFMLLHQYAGRLTLNHFDLYRLKDIRQLEQIGYEEYFYGEAVTVVEWADRVKGAFVGECLRIEFKIQGENKRLLRFVPKGKRYAYNFRKLKRQNT